MSYQEEKGAENFRSTDNSVRTNLRYQIEAEKQFEGFNYAYNRRARRISEDAAIFNFVGSLFKGIFYLLSAIIYLIFKKRNHEEN
jgi:hypothetical protein